MSINDLDKHDDRGNLYHYYVLETVPSFGNELYEVNDKAGAVTIKNKVAPETVHLKVTKKALEDDPREESLDRDFEFTLKLKQDDNHPIRSWPVYTDVENPENNLVTDWNGEAKFKLKPTKPQQQPTASSFIILDLPAGVTAAITETYNPEYTVGMDLTVTGAAGDNGRTFSYETNGEDRNVSLDVTNTLRVVCKVVDDNGRSHPFESLHSALAYIRSTRDNFTAPWKIYMLEDYAIPATDAVSVQEGESLTLTTAATDDELFPFNGGEEADRATITRSEAGHSMVVNNGELTLANICLDGGSLTITEDGGLVHSTGTLNLEDKTTLRNSVTSGTGGAVYATGQVNIDDGVTVSSNSASSASALYMSGTLNMTGGSIVDNKGASDGAVVVEASSDRVNLSGNPKIFGNTNDQGAAANLCVDVDSDNVVNVRAPGLREGARIGVSALEGHRLIGEQFATAEFEQTANLACFTNDAYGYRGKLKDGTSTNVVWDGLKLTIEHDVDPQGANPNDSFTITLSSHAIVSNTYIIDGTLDYSVSVARQGRPGRITLRGVKGGKTISISPLPVGEYTIAEEASNYDPIFSASETGEGGASIAIDDGKFTAENDSTITVTNKRKTAPVKLTKTLDDRLKAESETQEFGFTVTLADEDGAPLGDFTLAEGVTTDASGNATCSLSPTNATPATLAFTAPVNATMTITETENPDYRIEVSAVTLPKEEGVVIDDKDTDHENVFAFTVTGDGADVTFDNTRKMAEIELRKILVGKVSEIETHTFNVTLIRADRTPAASYTMYRDNAHPENNIVTNDDGRATITFDIGKDESAKVRTLTIPQGTKLMVAEEKIKKTVGNSERLIYDTTYSVNGAAATSGSAVTIDPVSDDDHSIVFTNARKINMITVNNTVKGYSGNVVPFTYTAIVTDGEGKKNDYDAHGFTDGAMTFELTSGQTKTLMVPYGAKLTITEGFVVGYETTVKNGNADLGTVRSADLNVADNRTVAFTNSQLIGLRLENYTSSELKNVQVYVGYGTRMYRVRDEGDDQDLVEQTSGRWATLGSIEAGKTAQLEIMHKTGATDEQDYTVKGVTPAVGYYYTINNEPSFHETANPAIMRVYDAADFEVKGKLRYSVQDSTVTFTEQPLVSFDPNGGTWTTEMDDYNDRDGDRKVYQKAVTTNEKVAKPSPDPIYPTSEGIEFLGWTTYKEFAESAHSAGDNISQKAYGFNTPVTGPITLYAVWAKPVRDTRVVTVKNGRNEGLRVTATLTQNDEAFVDYAIADGERTDAQGEASFTLAAGENKNLTVPDGAKLVFDLTDASLVTSSEYTLASSGDNKSHTIAAVNRDGTVTFIPGVCKITDADGNVLYNINGNPAVYGTLSDAFTAYGGKLYTDTTHATEASQAAVKLLVDEYTITEATPITFPNASMILTTAGREDRDYPYAGIRDRGAIYRSAAGSDNNCFKMGSGSSKSDVTLTDIILDGGSERGVRLAASISGGLIRIEAGVLSVGTGATLRNCEFSTYDNKDFNRGGAIYLKGGSLNVSGGLFSNLHARRGGAICCDANGTLNITGTGIRFENCSANDSTSGKADDAEYGNGDGGAIYYSNSQKGLKIGNDTDDPAGSNMDAADIVFASCMALGNGKMGQRENKASGGAIYVTTSYNQPVSIYRCSFIECSARTTETTNGSNGGGAICANGVSGLTVSHCAFNACDTLSRGGAVVAMVKNGGEVSTVDSIFEGCNCKGQGGGVAVYQQNMEGNAPGSTDPRAKTKLSVNGCSFSNCSSGTDNGSGGAIQCYVPCMEFIGSTFTDCWAGKEGGAVNNYFGNGYTAAWPGSYLTMNGCKFTRCRAEDRYEVTSVVHYGGAVNTKVKSVTVDNCTFTDCVSTLQDGGALHLGGCGNGSTAHISNSEFTRCSAKKHGGAVFSSAEKMEVSGTTFSGCRSTADSGGAVYHGFNCRTERNIKNSTVITDCEFKDGCSAAQSGGAVWTSALDARIQGCTISGSEAKSGGALYFSNTDFQTSLATVGGIKNVQNGQTAVPIAESSGSIIGGSISNCTAESGSAAYVGNSATLSSRVVNDRVVTDLPLSVTGNTVSDINSGAIQAVDTGKLYFEGDVKVENNVCSADSTYKHDVLMQKDDVDIIHTTENGLGLGAHVGVYVPDNTSDKRALEGQAFGTYNNGEQDDGSHPGSNYLESFFNDRDSELFGYQLADDDTKIYWGIFVCKITDKDGNTLKRPNGRDAVYQKLSMALGEFTQATTSGGDTDKAVYIKMLLENYDIRQSGVVSNFPAADVTLTTASKSDDKYPYRGREGTFCTISRNNSETEGLFKLDTEGAKFRLENITLDGRKDKTGTTSNYRLIEAAKGELYVNSGTTMQYGTADTYGGGAIYATDALVTINGSCDTEKEEGTVKFLKCTTTGDETGGGAIRAQNLTIANTPPSEEEQSDEGHYGTSFMDCSAPTGGAIYVTGANTSIEDAMFQNCYSTNEGGAVHHDTQTTESSLTTINNSSFANCHTNQSSGGAVSSKAAILTVEESRFMSCVSEQNGGAINHVRNGSTTITGSEFNGCHANGTGDDGGCGGFVYTKAATVNVTGGSYKNGSAVNYGGALYCEATNATTTVEGSLFKGCSTTSERGKGGAIYTKGKTLTLKNNGADSTEIDSCMALGEDGKSGAVYLEAGGSTLNVEGDTKIANCFVGGKGGAIYLKARVTMNLNDINGSPEFIQNGYRTRDGTVENVTQGACIYLEEGSRINLAGSPRFSRNILAAQDRVTNGGVSDYARQDIYLAGYASGTAFDTNAESIYVTGDLSGDTIWVWPEEDPHRKPNEQFAKIAENVTVTADGLGLLRNALSDSDTHCGNGEYLAGVQINDANKNVYWDKMYVVSFKKVDNKGVTVPDAVFTLYGNRACEETDVVATAKSADGVDDTDTQGNRLGRGMVQIPSVRIGVYYMRETTVPTSFKENDATYLVLVGSPYLVPNADNVDLWSNGGPLDGVAEAATLVARYTVDAGKYYGIFPLDENGRAVLRANLASNNVGVQNIRNDYHASFMKVDNRDAALPGAAFTIYAEMLDSDGKPDFFEDGYPKLMRWSRDGENYPAPVVSADGTATYRDVNNNTLPKGMVYFRELPIGTYYLLETAYPERNGDGRRTFYVESDRVFKLELTEVDGAPGEAEVTMSEWKPGSGDAPATFEPLVSNRSNYKVANQEVVCKLTDNEDNLLYTEGHKVWDYSDSDESVRRFPAIYATLEEGFSAAQTGTFVYANGTPADMSKLKLKVLKDCELTSPVVYDNAGRDITFTTAETRVLKDRYIFSTTRTTDAYRAQIKRAYSEDESRANANTGALITLASGANMGLQNIRLVGQKDTYNGRAIHATEGGTLAIGTSVRIEYFKQEVAEGSAGVDVKGGAILLDDGTTLSIDGGYNRSAVFANNAAINHRQSSDDEGEGTGADGGAIALGINCTISVDNAQFTSNSATVATQTQKRGTGGAISISEAEDINDSLKLSIKNVVFSSNKASYRGGAICTVGNCSLKISNCTFNNNKAAGSESEGGAIAARSKQETPAVLTITNGTKFTKNEAKSGGAVRIGGYGTLNMDDVTISDENTATNGGAISVASCANVSITGGKISGNKATDKGGAIFVGSKQGQAANVSINGATLTSNTANLGSAVYAADYAEVTFASVSITGNKADDADGGAINVGGANARLNFGGNLTVFDNFSATDTAQQKNLILSEDTNEVVNTTEGGLVGGVIGVFVIERATDDNSTVFEGHGLPGKPFGTFRDGGKRLNPQVFRSDHSLALYGVRNEDDTTDNAIYWVDVICKLTDGDDNILYQDIMLTINGKRETRKGQAVYARITDYGDSTAIQNGFNALRDGFDAANGTLYSREGNAYETYPATDATDVKLKMLQDVSALDKTTQYVGERRVTFTTAEGANGLSSQQYNSMRSKGDFFLYRTSRTGENNDKALIARGFDNGSMVNDNGTHLTMANIMLDGGGHTSEDGGIVSVQANKALTVSNGSVLRNASTEGNGGAIYVKSLGAVTVSGGTISSNTATGNGGALYVEAGATATVSGGTISSNTAKDGAGIYLVWNGTDDQEHAVLKLSGSVSFGGADRVTQDELDNDSVTDKVIGDLKGAEGNFVHKGADFKTEDKEPTNGARQYQKDESGDYLVRQDIYISGTADPHNVIQVTDAITSEAGAIWVWADKVNHYEMLKQFAVFSDAGASLSEDAKEASMKAFRNAQPDYLTNCGGDYLTGQKGEHANWIYWTGGFDVIFLKTNSSGEALPGVTFTLYNDKACSDPAEMSFLDGKRATTVSSDGKATYKDKNGNSVTLEKGEVLLSKVPPKTFYLKETAPAPGYDRSENTTAIYQVTISGTGELAMKQKGASDAFDAEVFKEKRSKKDSNGETIELMQYVVTNIPEGGRKVILRKVNEGYASLEGAEFQIYRYDGTLVSSTAGADGSPSTTTTFTSGKSGVYFVGELPSGVYYIKETKAPTADGYSGNKDKWFCLIVDDTGTYMSEKGYKDTDDLTGKEAAKNDAEAVKAKAKDKAKPTEEETNTGQ